MKKLPPLFAVLALSLLALPAFAQDDEEPAAEAPEGWTCTASFYGGDDGCDCGCGIPDPDCEDASADTCQYEWCDNGDPDPADTTQCIDTPPPTDGWTCTPSYYGGGDGCDCGCGAPDTDCEDNTYESCRFNYCGEGMRPAANDPSQCEEGEWTPPDNDATDDGFDPDPVDDGSDDDNGEPDPSGDDDDTPAGGDDSGGPDLGPTGGNDSGGNDSSGNDSGGNDSGGSAGGEADVASGCSATPSEPVAAFFLGLVLLAWRRRRRA